MRQYDQNSKVGGGTLRIKEFLFEVRVKFVLGIVFLPSKRIGWVVAPSSFHNL